MIVLSAISAISSIIAMALDNHQGMVMIQSIQFMPKNETRYTNTRTRTHVDMYEMYDIYDIIDYLYDRSQSIVISDIRRVINEIISDMRWSIGRYRTAKK